MVGHAAGAGVQPSTVRNLRANPSTEHGVRDTSRAALPRSQVPATAKPASTASNGDAPLPPALSCWSKCSPWALNWRSAISAKGGCVESTMVRVGKGIYLLLGQPLCHTCGPH